jgi:hypothetical protein
MKAALSRHADEAYDDLAKGVDEPIGRHRQLAEKLFRCITERGQDNREVRRPAKLDDICKIVDAGEAEMKTVINAFRKKGRSFLVPPEHMELTSESLVDISHESLIRQWKCLRKWVDIETEDRKMYSRIVDTARRHEQEKGGLLHDPDLLFALDWGMHLLLRMPGQNGWNRILNWKGHWRIWKKAQLSATARRNKRENGKSANCVAPAGFWFFWDLPV